jgi:hypothetical protein
MKLTPFINQAGWVDILGSGNLRDLPDILAYIALIKDYDNAKNCITRWFTSVVSVKLIMKGGVLLDTVQCLFYIGGCYRATDLVLWFYLLGCNCAVLDSPMHTNVDWGYFCYSSSCQANVNSTPSFGLGLEFDK